jgi:hypothetical protein
MSYTKGEWFLDKKNYNSSKKKDGVLCSIKTNEWYLAEVQDSCDSHDTGGNAESEANARLMAAAPELLMALLTLKKGIEYANSNDSLYAIGNSDIKLIESAISKALLP